MSKIDKNEASPDIIDVTQHDECGDQQDMASAQKQLQGQAVARIEPQKKTREELQQPEELAFEEEAAAEEEPVFEKPEMPDLLRCLSIILRMRGRQASDSFLMSELAGGKVTSQSCIAACRKAGLEGEVVKRELGNLSDIVLPCIIFLKDNQPCVLLKKEGDDAILIFPDEPSQAVKIKIQNLEKSYAGEAVLTKVDKAEDVRGKNAKAEGKSAWFWDVIRHYWPIYRHVAVASVVINLIAIASPLFVMNVYDRVVPNNAVETLWTLAVGIALIYFFNFVLTTLRTHFVDTAAASADTILQSRLAGKILSMKMGSKPESTGALVNHIREFEHVREFFSSGSLLALIDLPFMIVFLLMIVFIGGPLVFVPILAVPFVILASLYFQAKTRKNVQSAFKQNMHKNALLIEMVEGLETIKSCQAEAKVQRLYEAICGMSSKSNYMAQKYNRRAIAVTVLATQIVTLAMIIWGCYRIADGEMTMGALIGVNIIVGRIMAPIMQLTGLITRYQTSRVAFQALDMLMQIPSENQNNKSCMEDELLPAHFVLEDVSFTYPGASMPTLRNINLEIRPGERVGIIGSIGSGKSTLARILTGIYEPQEGAAKFGGVNIRQIAVSDLRGRMGVFPQEVTLFYGTIKDNITMGDAIISDRMILNAARLSGMSDMLKNNPEGFAMQVGEQGKALSGGERQTVALARTFVKNPEILVLDEPTSNMDAQSERNLQERLLHYMQGKTLILVTHRSSMLKIVNRVVVMRKGRIVLDGPRDEVLKKLIDTGKAKKAKEKAAQTATAPQKPQASLPAANVAPSAPDAERNDNLKSCAMEKQEKDAQKSDGRASRHDIRRTKPNAHSRALQRISGKSAHAKDRRKQA